MIHSFRHLTCISLASLIFFFCSCEKVIDISADDIESLPVLLSKPEADSAISVSMSWSRFFLDNHPFVNITDATVSLSINGTDFSPASSANGLYHFSASAHPGDSLTLRAFVPSGNHQLEASTRVPYLPDYEIVKMSIDTDSYDAYCRLRIKLTNLSLDTRYYRLNIYNPIIEYQWNDSLHAYDTTSIRIDTSYRNLCNLEISDRVLTGSTGLDIISDDEDFEGRQFEFSTEPLNTDSYEFDVIFRLYSINKDIRRQILNYLPIAPIRVVIHSLSYDLYRYSVTAKSQSTIQQLFMEPVQVHCNVDGGIGIFGASSSKETRVRSAVFEHFYDNNDFYYESTPHK